MDEEQQRSAQLVPWWKPVIFAAMAGGMGWGIRGQYGHEVGAMIAGNLIAITMCLVFCKKMPVDQIVRIIALGTIAMGIGGSMTYGETVGLTHDYQLHGNWAALRWGMIGLAIKGGLWIGFFGIFLGMGLSGHNYKPQNMIALMLAALGAYFIGINTINYPFNPFPLDSPDRALPYLYFSDHWHWEPIENIKPRWENWGGILLALLTVFIYIAWWVKDKLARNMALWGLLAGGIGFPLGQSVQAFKQWNDGAFTSGIWSHLSMNWWNTMETTFGTTLGAIIGLGLWVNQKKIGTTPVLQSARSYIPVPIEIVFITLHIFLLGFFEFYFVSHVDHFNDVLYELGLVMGFIPIVLIIGGRFSAYLIVFPVVLQSIAGKTVRDLVYKQIVHEDGTRDRVYNEAAQIHLPFLTENVHLSFAMGWTLYFIIPMGIAISASVYFYRKHQSNKFDPTFSGNALLIMGWIFFSLNFAFFGYPWPWEGWGEWPWEKWGGPNTMSAVFLMYMLSLTSLVLFTNYTYKNQKNEVEKE
jgi:hypothetical protein